MNEEDLDKIKIGLYVPVFYPWVLHLQRSFQKKGHWVHSFTSGIYGNYPEWKNMQEDINVLPTRLLFGDRLLKFNSLFRPFKDDPDFIILSGTETSASLSLAMMSKLKRIPTLLIVEENMDVRRFYSTPVRLIGVLKKMLIKMIHRKADILLPETDASKDYLENMGCNSKDITVAPHGVNVNEFKPVKPDYDFAGSLHIDKNILERKLKVLYAGGYYKHKGIDVVIDILKKKLIDDKIMIFIPEFGDNIESYRSKLSSYKNVVLLPLLGYEELKKLYSLMDIVIVPSIEAKGTERSPNVIIEALAMGKTVIASNIGGIPTIMGNAGVLVEQNNPDELAVALNKVSDDREYLGKYSKKARGHAVKTLNADVYCETMINKYYSIINKVEDKGRGEL